MLGGTSIVSTVAGFLPLLVAVALLALIARWIVAAFHGAGLYGGSMADRARYWRWLWDQKQWWFLRPLPDEYETVIFTGLPGFGKTTFGTDYVCRFLRRGVRVYSNIYLRDTWSGRQARPIHTWLDVMEASIEALEDGVTAVIYLAEINMMCDARDWQYTPRWWTEFMQQRRHMGIGLVGDTQNVSQVEKRLRMLIGRIVEVRPSWLRQHWRRWPAFVARDISLMFDDPAVSMPPGKERRVWQYSHAFHGHATWELLAGQDFGDLDSPESIERIEELRQRAIALNNVSELPAFRDDLLASGELIGQEEEL